ncbi:phage protein NinX family protein [Burkholderia plantarii]|uniref:phage protein NinX family protein n=1 Tax=Burkholderia plantarii TaxID=41899 RepID=UPI0009F2B32A|nr:phage protein NinX family protein [Burkholderia plantarii]
MKVMELTGAWLDYWVAIARGTDVVVKANSGDDVFMYGEASCWVNINSLLNNPRRWRPTRDWGIAGSIIEREGMEVSPLAQLRTFRPGEMSWRARYAHAEPSHTALGCTPLEAAMRAFVHRWYGDEVPDREMGR